jgi:hypothetical protein
MLDMARPGDRRLHSGRAGIACGPARMPACPLVRGAAGMRIGGAVEGNLRWGRIAMLGVAYSLGRDRAMFSSCLNRGIS